MSILNVTVFMYQTGNKAVPLTLPGSFEKICHGYATNFSQFSYKIPKATLSKSKFRISFRGPSIRAFHLNLFLFLNLNWNWSCFFSNEIKLNAFKTFQPWVSSQHPFDEKGLDDKAIMPFCDLPSFKNQYKSYCLQLE